MSDRVHRTVDEARHRRTVEPMEPEGRIPAEDVDPIDALGELPEVVGSDGRTLDNSPPARGPSWARLRVARYVLLGAVAAVAVGFLTGGDDEPGPAGRGDGDVVEVSPSPTDAARVPLDPEARHPEPAVIEELRWAEGATIEAVLFVDDCTAPHGIDAASDGEHVTVAVTVGTPADAGQLETCGDPTLVAVPVTVDDTWAGLPLTETAPEPVEDLPGTTEEGQ